MLIKMKKMICISFIILMFFILGGVNVYAINDTTIQNTIDISKVKAEDISVPDNANDFMEENNISISDTDAILSITPKKVLSYMWESFKDKLTEPLKILGGLLAVILLAAVIESMGDTVTNGNMSKIYCIISTLICVGMAADPICKCIQKTSDTLVIGGNFMMGYVPVFSSIVAASGNISSAGSYSMIVLAAAEIFTQLSSTVLMPLLGLCMALAVVEAINPAISLSGMTDGIKKIASWGIGLVMTVFVGMLTIQSIVGTSADTVTVKAAKFVVSSAVPVVGSAISDAYSTIKGSLNVLKSGVGSFGIIALILTVLPTIISVGAVQLVVFIAGIASEIFGVKQINIFLKNISSVLSIALSLLLCFLIMLIISTTIVMMAGLNMN